MPVYNAEQTLTDCLQALAAQSLSHSSYEVIVVDDGSVDDSAAIACRFDVRLIRQTNAGAAAARNTGWRAATGDWVAFTDADCVASRGWLKALLRAVRIDSDEPPRLGIAGKTLGFQSNSPAARFVDLIGSFDAERHLAHPRFPFAPSGNVMYRREVLQVVGGYDERYRSYEACELHERLRGRGAGRFLFEPSALVFHRHRSTWRQYWRQQIAYGVGYGQFSRHHSRDIRWSLRDEARAWGAIVALGTRACLPGHGDQSLIRRGLFVKALGQRVGFCSSYWNPAERSRW